LTIYFRGSRKKPPKSTEKGGFLKKYLEKVLEKEGIIRFRIWDCGLRNLSISDFGFGIADSKGRGHGAYCMVHSVTRKKRSKLKAESKGQRIGGRAYRAWRIV
jgi:hypothetical protein